ncbi:MAG TPA: protein translocase subunit SecD, partial [Bacteroidia bacterium]|nr:protein translocase subunit SecD [Bacteroidia bacterium]
MQNKGAIKVFAILLGLACIFYLSFTWVTRGVEQEALAYAEGLASSPKMMQQAKDYAKGNSTKELSYIDSVKTKVADRYLDSVKNLPAYSLGFASYTYEECKKREINLGLDLRGGMNVTLEVSVIDIIKNLSNNSADANFNKALDETQKNLGKANNDDFITLFEKTYKQVAPNGKLAPLFTTIENKGKIEYNATNEQVIKFIRQQVDESITNAEKTFRSRIDRFGVAQPNIQKLESSGRILVELPGVKDKARVRELLQGTANLEFWETYENQEVAQYFEKANEKLRLVLNPDEAPVVADSTKTDSLSANVAKADSLVGDSSRTADSIAKAALAANTNSVNAQDTAYKNFIKRYPLYSQLAPIKPSLYSDGKQQFFTPGPIVGLAYSKEDTAKANEYLRNEKVRSAFPSKMKFMWSSKAKESKNQSGEVVGSYFELYAIKITDRNGKAALFGDIITDARKDYDQKSGAHPYISMSMNSEAAIKWKNLTKANMPQGNKQGRCIAVVMDNMVFSAPRVQSEISGGQSQITGDFTNEEADALVAILSAGKLPAPARIVEENIVGPTLGLEAINSGLISFVIALLVILVFMAMYYNKAGVVANVALIANMFFIMGILTSLGAVLTLPGIAGIVLTIGLAVDANILIFERVREELALGKSTSQSIKEGFKHAMSSIIDSNVTLAILAVILMVFGTGPVQGFATTLLIGIGASLFSAILIT